MLQRIIQFVGGMQGLGGGCERREVNGSGGVGGNRG